MVGFHTARNCEADAIALTNAPVFLASLSELKFGQDSLVKDKGLCALAATCALSNLLVLDLSCNNIGDEGVCALANPKCPLRNLAFLNLYFNKIGLKGGLLLPHRLVH